MRIPGLLKLFAFAALLLAAAAAAQGAPTQVINDASYRAPPADYTDVEGEYTLSNGSLLDVVGRGRRLYARIDNTAPREIIATGPHDFVAADGSLRINFDQYENGVVPGLTMTMRVPR